MVEVGAVLVGKYRVDRVIGQGGMGVVVQATHLQLGQPVAMKFLLPEVLGNHEVVQRFQREAQAAVRLKSEHVARVIDVGTLDSGAPYMVLEYLEGSDLSQFPRSELTPGVIVDLMLQACEALAEAHALGIVHRDVKPANFFITRRPSGAPLLKVLDFGISKSTQAGDKNLTATQAVMGTPAYMSPEQLRSTRDVDGRSDLWSLGIVMYELFEGVQPFSADTFTEFAIRIAMDPPRVMTQLLPPGLGDVVMHCLEKDRDRRFASAAEVVRALAPFARSQTQAAVTLERTGAQSRGPGEPTIAARPASTLGHTRTTPKWPIIAGLGVVVAAGIAIAVVVSGGTKPAPTPTPAPTATPPAPPPPPPPVASKPPETNPVTSGSAAAPTTAMTTTTPAPPPVKPHAKPAKPRPAAGSSAPVTAPSGDDDILGARH